MHRWSYCLLLDCTMKTCMETDNEHCSVWQKHPSRYRGKRNPTGTRSPYTLFTHFYVHYTSKQPNIKFQFNHFVISSRSAVSTAQNADVSRHEWVVGLICHSLAGEWENKEAHQERHTGMHQIKIKYIFKGKSKLHGQSKSKTQLKYGGQNWGATKSGKSHTWLPSLQQASWLPSHIS